MSIHSRSLQVLSRVACASIVLTATAAPLVAQPVAQDSRPQFPRVQLTAGRSTVVATDFDVTRIAITNPVIADAVVVAPREILVDVRGAVSGPAFAARRNRQGRTCDQDKCTHLNLPGAALPAAKKRGCRLDRQPL
jgi:Flp pilus assembly secretin CpaC